jgi:hypothetical protein
MQKIANQQYKKRLNASLFAGFLFVSRVIHPEEEWLMKLWPGNNRCGYSRICLPVSVWHLKREVLGVPDEDIEAISDDGISSFIFGISECLFLTKRYRLSYFCFIATRFL